MAIENLLSGLALDEGFIAGSTIADAVSTYIFVNRDGINAEGNRAAREGMKNEGVSKWLCKASIKQIAGQTTIALGAYGLDYLLGIQDNTINLHHLYCYIRGAGGYSAALLNLVSTFNFLETFWVVGLPWYLISGARKGVGNYLRNLGGKLENLDSK